MTDSIPTGKFTPSKVAPGPSQLTATNGEPGQAAPLPKHSNGAITVRDFLTSVAPWPAVDADEPGTITINWQFPETEGFHGRSFRKIDAALAFVDELKAKTESNIYFCLTRQSRGGGRRNRKNATAVRALWVDIDVKPNSPDHYATLAEAIASLFWFCDRLGIPRPSIIVVTGGGLHAYWLSDRVLTIAEWQPYANALKAAAKTAGLKIDAACTSDAARVLRVPDTRNFKYGPPRRVRLLQSGLCNGLRHDFATVFAKLLLSENKASPRPNNRKIADQLDGIEVPSAFKDVDPNIGLADGISGEHWYGLLQPAQKDEVVDYALGVIVAFLENNGGHTNPLWYRLTTAVARSGAPNAEEIFVKHARSTKNPEPEDFLRQHFARCQNSPPPEGPEITIGTLLGLAREHGADFGKWRREHEAQIARRRAEQIKQNIEIGDDNGDVIDLAVPLILTPNEMIARLVWVGFSGAVVDRVTFRTRKKEQATTEYAASVYYPKEDEGKENAEKEDEGETEGGPKTKKIKVKPKKPKPTPCLNIWVCSPKRTTVDVLAWVPGGPQFCRPPEDFNGAQTAFNMWRGITPMPTVENWQVLAEPFVEHMAYLVPVERERQRFMQWLAHSIQAPEVLPHTAYLMVAEKTGIGRNWLSSVLVRVLRGYVAAGVSLPELLDGGFNGRLSCKLLAIVDELREGPGNQRYQRAQNLKTIITEENRLINPKFGFQSVQKNCCRWLMFSNFFDALPFDNTDRRIETIANPTVRKTAAYYEYIYSLLHNPAFIASVWWLLKTMDISGFKPGAHAAMNEAKERALSEMMTDVDRAVFDFRDECIAALASRKDIEAAALSIFHTVNITHLTHAITHAEMINTGRRVKDAHGTRHPIVIVDKAKWTIEMVKTAPVSTLLNAMGKPIKK